MKRSAAACDGVLLLDKPVGVTSNFALQRAKRLLGAAKAGHAGTLDPLASGLLLVLLGQATKLAAPLLDSEKEYVATVRLGVRTTTGDAEGEILETREVATGVLDALPAVLARFRGEIGQVPPMHSALKRGGVPLYVLARRNESVEREVRRVTIHELEVLRYTAPLLELKVRCSKGTYVRTLAEDIGRALGTGAHLAGLRRTVSGRFAVSDGVTLEQLERMTAQERAARVLPLKALLQGLPEAHLDDAAEGRFRQGAAVRLEGLAGGTCAVFGRDGRVLGLGSADGQGGLRPLRLMMETRALGNANG